MVYNSIKRGVMAMNLTNIKYWNKIATQSLINIFTGGEVLLSLPKKNIKRSFSLMKELFIVIIAVAISAGAGAGAFAYLKKDVVINDNGKIITCTTMKNTFKEVLDQNDIDVGAFDYISVPLETALQRTKTNEIHIKRAVPVYITADGRQTKIMTYRDTVGEMLEDSDIKPGDKDRLEGAELQDRISSGMTLKIVRVDEKEVTEEDPIPYQVQRVANSKLDSDNERVVQQGQEGVLEKKYLVVTEDGKEVSRQLISETILKNPVNMIVEFGTILKHRTSRGDTLRYKKVLDMKATAYTASLKDTGKAPGHPLFGITATGTKARKGVIAVDPNVIPLHTKVYVEILGSTPDYGFAVAEDVGGAIKGNKIDLYYDDQDFVDRFGVKRVRVYILSDN